MITFLHDTDDEEYQSDEGSGDDYGMKPWHIRIPYNVIKSGKLAYHHFGEESKER